MPPMPHVEGMTHRYVRVGDVTLHVAEAGAGPPVLLLHGWPQHWYVWRDVAPRLAEDHRVICPDLRGFGWSDAPPGEYRKQTLADDMIALLDALELERVDLIGHDWGGWIGFIMCLDHPQRFKHYLALNINPPWPGRLEPSALPRLLRLWYQALNAAPVLGPAVIAHTPYIRTLITAGAVHRDAWTDADLEHYSAVLREPARTRASMHLYRTFLLRELVPFVRGQNDHRRLTVPTVLLHGTRDLAIDHRAMGDWESHADDMKLELRDDSGHFICEEIPDVVAERARRLFAG
jgi:pimeloyl-ACP methyl ester carboxylesterase